MAAEPAWTRIGDDGVERCWWGAGQDPDYVRYHDQEWGRPVGDDVRLFEKLVLEGFQSGLSWLTILRKRERFRAAFAGFDPERVARFGDADVARLLADAGIVRHRGKIEAAIHNARCCLDLVEDEGSLAAYVWRHEPDRSDPEPDTRTDWSYPVASVTATSTRLSKDLKRRGWRFVGPTTVYAFMQAMGLVNDHVPGCHARVACETARAGFRVPA
jgi:DNA-3-methyladenine glycosylase I